MLNVTLANTGVPALHAVVSGFFHAHGSLTESLVAVQPIAEL
jgi:hypothetical protein